MPRPLKRGILGASTMILSKDIDKYAFMCGSNFNETDVSNIYFCQLPFSGTTTAKNQQFLRDFF